MAKKNFSAHLQQASQGQKDTETYVKTHLAIDEELKALIPPLGDEEIGQLEQNILTEGVRDPLVVWKGENLLLDGHNRYAIAQKHGLDFQIVQKEFASREEAKSWMINNQLGRRNLTNEQQSYLRGKRYENEKQLHGGARKGEGSSSQFANLKTSDLLASEYNVSKDTIIRDAKFARGIDLVGASNPQLKQDILVGQAKVKKGDLWALADHFSEDDSPALSLQTVADIRKLLDSFKDVSSKDLVSESQDESGAEPIDLAVLVEELKSLLDQLAAGKRKRTWSRWREKVKALEVFLKQQENL